MTVLTDDERSQAIQSIVLTSPGTADQLARAIEAAVLAKLAQQEPVAWIGPTNLEWLAQSPENRMPLYTHPAPQQADKAQNEFNRVIQHAITLGSEAAQFLRCWNEGNWNGCREFDFEPALPYEIEGQADRQRLPDGCKVVPVEPTQEMLDAWQAAFHKQLHRRTNSRGKLKTHARFLESCEKVAYRAMLAAAPEAPAQKCCKNTT